MQIDIIVFDGLDLALWLVARECAPEIEQRVRRRMEYRDNLALER